MKTFGRGSKATQSENFTIISKFFTDKKSRAVDFIVWDKKKGFSLTKVLKYSKKQLGVIPKLSVVDLF